MIRKNLPKIAPMCATSAMGIVDYLREELKEAEEHGDISGALVASRQIDELEQLLEEGYFPPEGAGLDDLAPRVPPKGVEVILRLTIPRERFEDIMGSMVEQYARDCERFGEAQARWIAYVDAVKSVGPLVWLAVMWLLKGAP